MSFINLMADDVWTDADITNRARATIASAVSEARQNELRTIMLGHVAGLRTATPAELAEIMQVKALTEQAAAAAAQARADMALLSQVLAAEAGDPTPLSPAAAELMDAREARRNTPQTQDPAQP